MVGTESKYDDAIAEIKLDAPGPLVASATEGTPENLVAHSAAKPADCSWRAFTIGVLPSLAIESAKNAVIPPES